MAISRDIKLTIKEDTASFEQKLYVYQNDKNIDIYITVVDYKYRITKELIFRNLVDAFVSVTVLKPNKIDSFKVDKIPLIEGRIKFTITEEFTNELDELGVYKIQFHIHDDDNARITIPEVEFEVKELIANVADLNNIATIDNAKVDDSIVSDEEIVILEGKAYIKTDWKSGDIITASKLNKIENKLGSLDTGLESKAESNHNHNENYEPVISNKGTAFNKNFGSSSGQVAEGNHTHTQYASSSHSHSEYVTNTKLTETLNNHKIWSGSQVEYDAIGNKDSNTLYFIIE